MPQGEQSWRVDGPASAGAVLLLAHGSGAPLDDPLQEALAVGVAAAGVRVVRFEFPYMARRRAGERAAVDDEGTLEECFRGAAARAREAWPGCALCVGGVSLGARVACAIAGEVAADGLVGVSFPFLPAGRPRDRWRVALLQAVGRPALIVQGTRDRYGNREQVRGFRLGEHVEVVWLEDANHGLVPRARSGLTRAEHLATAAAAIGRFVAGAGH